jgi:stromal membrane-associated protein
MPVSFRHHHGTEPKSSSAASSANQYAYGGNAVSQSAAIRPFNVAVVQASGSRSAGVTAEQLQRFDVLLRRPENRECFDCGAKQPRWASTNLGIFFCLRCAGIHRSMGTHISKVKSTNMDAWEASMIHVMEHIGNARGRVLYEYNMPVSARITSSTETSVMERALRAKYEKRTYYNPRFDALYVEFMETPLEGVSSPVMSAQQQPNTDNNGAGLPSEPSAPPRRAPQSQASLQPPLEELWNAPVSSSIADQTSEANAKGAANNHNVTSVAELFSGSYPAGVGAGPWQNMAWNASHTPSNNTANNKGSASPYASPSSATNSDWFDSNFGGSNGNPRASGAPSPATPHSPYNAASSSRNNTDDLFQVSGGTPTSGRNGGGPKDEILSLFASAPVAGAGGQPGGAHSSPNSGHPMAWQPQMIKPYYYPE